MYKPTPLSPKHTLNGDLSKPPNKELPLPALANMCSHQGTRWRPSRREHWKEGISASNDFIEASTLNTHHGHFVHTHSQAICTNECPCKCLSTGSRLVCVRSCRMLLQRPISVYKIYKFNYRMQNSWYFPTITPVYVNSHLLGYIELYKQTYSSH